MGSKKIKIGEVYNFNFAGDVFEGKLTSIDKSSWGTVSHIFYRFEHEDGTIYPVRKEAII